MKKLFTIIICLLVVLPMKAQLINQGAKITIESEAKLTATQDIRNEGQGDIENRGEMVAQGSIINVEGSLKGSGLYRIGGNFDNKAVFIADTSTILFDGADCTINSGGYSVYRLALDAPVPQKLVLHSELNITKGLDMASPKLRMRLDSQDLRFVEQAEVSGAGEDRYIVTNGSGRVIKEGMVTFVFPLGFDSIFYNPVTLTAADTADIAVRCAGSPLEKGVEGPPLSDAVQAGWYIDELNAGPTPTAFDITLQWSGLQEPASFDRSTSSIFYYAKNNWQTDEMEAGQADGSDPYTQDFTKISGNRAFAVGDGCILMDSLTLMEDPIPSRVYKVDDYLNVTGLVAADSAVTFVGGKEIIWAPGFEAEVGSSAHAYIEGCAILVSPPPLPPEEETLFREDVTTTEPGEENTLFALPFVSAYPNPFRNRVTVQYQLEEAERVSIQVFDGRGNRVKTVMQNTRQEMGVYRVELDTSRLSPGMYLVVMEVGPEVRAVRLVKTGG